MVLLFALIGLVPLISGWVGCYLLSREMAARGHLSDDVRISICFACVIWGSLVALVTEFCGVFRHLQESWILLSWTFISATLILVAFDFRRKRGASLRGSIRGRIRRVSEVLQTCPWDIKCLMAMTILWLVFLGLLGAMFPATTWDSMTYHLPRVIYWIDQHAVDHFPTENGRQLESGPWSGFALATVRLLSGTDQFFNALQWFSLLFCVIASTWIAKRLLCLLTKTDQPDPVLSLRAQVMAMILVATLPAAVVQALTTQTDLNTAWWVVCFVVMSTALLMRPEKSCYAVGSGLALGLGLLTKATALIYVGPMMMFGLPMALPRLKTFRHFLRHGVTILLCCLFLNMPQFIRNSMVFGSPLSSHFMKVIQYNQRITVDGAVSNLIRNLALHTDSGVETVTRILNKFLEQAHGLTGRSLSDPELTYGKVAFQFQRDFYIADDYAGNLYHLLLIFLAGGILLRRLVQNGALILYGAACGSGFLLFCAVIRWQPCHSRFHLPLFLVLMPLVAAVLAAKTPGWVQRLSLAVVFGYALFCLGHNQSCPFWNSQFRQMPRDQQMLIRQPHLYAPMVAAATFIVAAECSRVGIKTGYDGFEYPFWKILLDRGYHGRIGHAFSEEMSLLVYRNFDYKRERLNPRVQDASGLIYCSSRNPDVLVTTGDIQPNDSITKALPCHSNHGPIVLYWSSNAYQKLTNQISSISRR